MASQSLLFIFWLAQQKKGPLWPTHRLDRQLQQDADITRHMQHATLFLYLLILLSKVLTKMDSSQDSYVLYGVCPHDNHAMIVCGMFVASCSQSSVATYTPFVARHVRRWAGKWNGANCDITCSRKTGQHPPVAQSYSDAVCV